MADWLPACTHEYMMVVSLLGFLVVRCAAAALTQCSLPPRHVSPQGAVLLGVMCSFDWENLARRAKQRVAEGHAALLEQDVGHHGVFEPLIGAQHI